MKLSKFKTGDKVEIIPHKDHIDFVKKRYGKSHEVLNVIRIGFDDYIYELSGIPAPVDEEELKTYKSK